VFIETQGKAFDSVEVTYQLVQSKISLWFYKMNLRGLIIFPKWTRDSSGVEKISIRFLQTRNPSGVRILKLITLPLRAIFVCAVSMSACNKKAPRCGANY
jgi:hypothetical protein